MSSKLGYFSDFVSFILIFLMVFLIFVIFYYFVYRRRYDFYRTGRNILLLSSPICGFLIAGSRTRSIPAIIITIIGCTILVLLLWPGGYRNVKNTEWLRESIRKKYGEKHPWVNKVTYFPDADKEKVKTQTDSLGRIKKPSE